jgi:hypothetical protein
MCRWMAWRGQPIPIEEPLFKVPETTAVWCGPTAPLEERPFVPQTAVRA